MSRLSSPTQVGDDIQVWVRPMRVRVRPAVLGSLRRHLARQGFPATETDDGVLEVLFPGSAAIFGVAAELDLWDDRDDQHEQFGVVIEAP